MRICKKEEKRSNRCIGCGCVRTVWSYWLNILCWLLSVLFSWINPFLNNNAQEAPKNSLENPTAPFSICKGFVNPSLDCFMNSVMQCLLCIPEFSAQYYHNERENDGHLEEDIGYKYYKEDLRSKFLGIIKSIVNEFWEEGSESMKLEKLRSRYDQEFNRYEQHDSGLFMLELFESIQKIEVDYSAQACKCNDHREAWRQYRTRCSSIIDLLFVGMYESIFKCMGCTDEVKVYEEFKTISLYCDQSNPEASFKEFLDHPESTESNQMMCKGCGSIKNCQISKRIVKYPKYMILAFQRLDPINQTKINGKMHYKEEFIRYCPLVKKELTYKIKSVIIHRGEVNYGHYTAMCKRGKGWVFFNDSYLENVEEFINDDAYILFYETDDIDIM